MEALQLRELTRKIRREKGDNTLSPVIGGVVILVCNNEDNHKNKGGFWKMGPRNFRKVEELKDFAPFGVEDIKWRKISEDNFFGRAVHTFCTMGSKFGYEELPEDKEGFFAHERIEE